MVIALYLSEDKLITSQGIKRGIITNEPRGEIVPGYPFRSIFYLPEIDKTFNEISFEEEVEIGHRKEAIKKITSFLKRELK